MIYFIILCSFITAVLMITGAPEWAVMQGVLLCVIIAGLARIEKRLKEGCDCDYFLRKGTLPKLQIPVGDKIKFRRPNPYKSADNNVPRAKEEISATKGE